MTFIGYIASCSLETKILISVLLAITILTIAMTENE
jgi:hypothetical protein